MEQPNKGMRSDNPKARDIGVEALCTGDRVLVQTQRSLYQFSISDVPRKKGLLSGGSLGEQTVEATLAGTILDGCVDFGSWELKPGARAVFFIEKERCAERLVTSPITAVILDRNNLRKERAA